MKITYDPQADAMYIELIEGDHECRTINLSPQIALNMANLGSGETLVGIEVLDAKEFLGTADLPQLSVNNVNVRAA